MRRRLGLIASAVVLVTGPALAQAQTRPASARVASTIPAAAGTTDAVRWPFFDPLYSHAVPDHRDCAQLITADRLHLETRNDDEDVDTGSARVDCVSGQTPGIASGAKGSSSRRKLELCSEGEYLDADRASGSFADWSELTLAPADGFRFGSLPQPTLAYDADRTLAQAQSRPASAPVADTVPAAAEATDAGRWSFSGSVYAYSVPDDRDYLQPTITADRDWLHLELRYNYEDLDTGSVWVGYNLSGGGELAWEVTPMLGGVFGHTTGIAPGYKGSLSWAKLELYSEGEYLIDADHASDSFFYNWSELTLAPVDWFRFGLVTQRTRAYDADRDIQRGLLLGLSLERLAVTAYVLNLDTHDPTYVLSFGLGL